MEKMMHSMPEKRCGWSQRAKWEGSEKDFAPTATAASSKTAASDVFIGALEWYWFHEKIGSSSLAEHFPNPLFLRRESYAYGDFEGFWWGCVNLRGL
jgi:hypothetical protein